jgi:carboxylesterase
MSVVFSFDKKEWLKPDWENDSASQDGFSMKGDNGATVVLIHGMTGTPNEMKYLAEFLNRKGYSVICPRLAKHGAPIRVLKYAKWQEFYESVRSIFTSGELAGNKGPIFTSGLSMGALLALLLADEFKERIAGVSCLAPTLFYDGWNSPASKIFLPFAYYTPLKYFAYFKEEPPYGIKNKAMQERIHKYYGDAKLDSMDNVAQYGYPYFPVTLLYQLQLLVKRLSKKLPLMDVPAQLIQAKDDDMTSVKNSKYIYDNIKSEMKEIVLLYDSYHVITADQEREIVGEKIDDFFGRIMKASKQ